MEDERREIPERVAVVTGANKGIGLEVVRQLLLNGVTVILTARDDKRGATAVKSLKDSGLENVVFHQLDVRDPASAASLAEFVRTQFGKLDILVNNAGASGVCCDVESLKDLNIDPMSWLSGNEVTKDIKDVIWQTEELAEICLDTNYYGCKRVVEALIPLLLLSKSGACVVNVSSLRSELKRIPNEKIRKELGDINNLTETRIEELLQKFMKDMRNGKLESEEWGMMLPAYSISKATLNAYTRLLAKKYPEMQINCVHPGYVNTDLNWHTGVLTADEGAKGPVMLALLPADGPTGCYFDQTKIAEF